MRKAELILCWATLALVTGIPSPPPPPPAPNPSCPAPKKLMERAKEAQCCPNNGSSFCGCPDNRLCCENVISEFICINPPLPSLEDWIDGVRDKRSVMESRCTDYISCMPTACNVTSPYRTIDGSCNNLNHPFWGRTMQPFLRHIPAAYQDGLESPRVLSVTGNPLPSTRVVSLNVHWLAPSSDLSTHLTHMYMLWGQFIDHDISHTPNHAALHKCCDDYGNVVDPSPSGDCFPIEIPPDDPYYTMSCMQLVRSLAVPPGLCEGYDKREQINKITPYIDGGLIYGSDERMVTDLRAFRRGQLRTGAGGGLPVRPITSKCGIPEDDPVQECFLAGDSRVNEWAGLMGIQSTFLKEHNRIAADFYECLFEQHPLWSNETLDEKAYQEAKRVVVAELQVITYKEYLSHTLDQITMRTFGLNLGAHKYYDSINAQSSNEFATAAFRFGHSQIPFGFQPPGRNYSTGNAPTIEYVDMFKQPSSFLRVGHDDFMRGLISQPCTKSNNKVSKSVRDELFKKSVQFQMGLDLPAVNNQRGRDHGLQSYNSYRRFCELPVATCFSSLADHTAEMKAALISVYERVDDIDLFTGGLTETLIPGSQVGPLFTCLIAEQYKRLKMGDRFWFENVDTYPNAFSSDQISQLQQVTLSKVLCNNHDIEMVPADAFSLNSPMVPCNELPDLDVCTWLDTPPSPPSHPSTYY